VIATARNTDVLKDLEAKGMTVAALDITKEESIVALKATVEQIVTDGKLDVLVNNA
jgi:1-acylglycerone phosphate reductase